jgi:SAM-dependent methyltransferase
MNEASKAMRRRMEEDRLGIFNWQDIFSGRGIDVGCGNDKIPYNTCIAFDMEHGDANYLSKYFTDRFDYLHASQCLEHMHNPFEAILEWIKVVKRGGYLIVSIPDWDLYEGNKWPSRYNPDHKSTWSFIHESSPAKHHVNIYKFLDYLKPYCYPKRVMLVDTNYDYSLGSNVDQTFIESNDVEAFIELVLCKE